MGGGEGARGRGGGIMFIIEWSGLGEGGLVGGYWSSQGEKGREGVLDQNHISNEPLSVQWFYNHKIK